MATENFLLPKWLADFQTVLYKSSFGNTLPDSFKPCWLVIRHGARRRGWFDSYGYSKTFKKTISSESMKVILFCRHASWVILYKIPSSHVGRQEGTDLPYMAEVKTYSQKVCGWFSNHFVEMFLPDSPMSFWCCFALYGNSDWIFA